VATVQRGIDLAYDAGGGEVWVAAGTYGKVILNSFVHLYGGFAVGDAKSTRDWKTNVTILDGEYSDSVVTMGNVFGCRIDGFTIQNGTGSAGGISCSSALATTIANNIIRGNNGGLGGGLYAWGSTLTVAGNVFVDNAASLAQLPQLIEQRFDD